MPDVSRLKGKRRRKRSQQEIGEFEIHARDGAAKRRRQRNLIRQGIIAALCAVIVLSGSMIVSIVSRSVRTRRLNRELAQMRDTQQADMTVWAEETAEPVAMEETADAEAAPEQTPAPTPAPTDDLAVMLTEAPTAAPTPGREVFHRAMGEALANMEALYNENHDLIGWIEIPEILSLPVVYKDNAYYLTHDFYKKKNTSGTIFLDVNHRFTEHTQNLLLHGHNMKDGTMFGRLTQYVHDIDYFKRHAFVNYDTLWEKEQYVMFAVLRVSLDVKSEQFFNYFTHPTFRSESEFESFVRQAQLRSVYAVPLDLKPDDALLTLSTCMDEDRLVILCRRIREGETRSQLRQIINLAVKQ